MKLTYNTNTQEFKVGGKLFNDLSEYKKQDAITILRNLILNNSKLSDYEEDSVWMSYRYCIGRHTIAAHMRAYDIWKNCRGRMSKERELFNAYDINREIEQCMQFGNGPDWHFPITSLNKIYTTAIDIFCEFLEDYNIKSKEDYLKYYSIDVILTDNERGYKIETTTWEEWLRPQVHKFIIEWYSNNTFTTEQSWNIFYRWWKEGKPAPYPEVEEGFKKLVKNIPDPEYFYFLNIEDLFVWNDLAHCFDHEHHHKSILQDGTECTWFWSWTEKSEKHDDGYYYKAFGYKRIRVPLDKWNGSVITWIPDESIKEDIY